MVDHYYRVRLTTQTFQHVIASTVQLHVDHVVFLNSNGQLTALFLKTAVRSWNMLPNMVHDDIVLRRCSGCRANSSISSSCDQMAFWLGCSTWRS
jgi:hypothetical protein